ncbi:MAG: hypothetical protein ACRDQF_01215, partial [Thermocrispum sp.]
VQRADGSTADRVKVDGDLVGRMRAPDAYEYGLPVPREGFNADGTLRGEPVKDGSDRDLPADSRGAVSGALTIRDMQVQDAQPADGDRMARLRQQLISELTKRGYLPQDDSASGTGPAKRGPTLPHERAVQRMQQRNLTVIEQQLSADALEGRYDQLNQDGVRLWLQRPTPAGGMATVQIHLQLGPHTDTTYLGWSTDRVQVHLDIAQSSMKAQRSGGLRSALTGKIPFLSGNWGGTTDANNSVMERANLVTLLEQQENSPSHAWRVQQQATVTVTEGTHTVTVGSHQVSTEIWVPQAHAPAHRDDNPHQVTEDSTPLELLAHSSASVVSMNVKGLFQAARTAVDKALETLSPLSTVARADGGLRSPAGLAALSALTGTDTMRAYFKQVLTDGLGFELGIPGRGGFRHGVRISAVPGTDDAVLGGTTFAGVERTPVHGRISLNLPAWATQLTRGWTGGASSSPDADIEGVTGAGKVGGSLTRRTSEATQQVTGTEDINISTEPRFVFRTAVKLQVDSVAVEDVDHTGTATSDGNDVVWTMAESDAVTFYGKGKLSLPADAVLAALQRWHSGDSRLTTDAAKVAVQRLLAHGGLTTAQEQALSDLRPALDAATEFASLSLPDYLEKLLGIGGLSAIEDVQFQGERSATAVLKHLAAQVLGPDAKLPPGLAEAFDGVLTPSRLSSLVRESAGTEHVIRPDQVDSDNQLEIVIRYERADGQRPEIVGEYRKGFIQEQHYAYESETEGAGFEATAAASASGSATENEATPESEADAWPTGSAGVSQPGKTATGYFEEDIAIGISHQGDGTYQVRVPVKLGVVVRRVPTPGVKPAVTGAITQRPESAEQSLTGVMQLSVPRELAAEGVPDNDVVPLEQGPINELPFRVSAHHVEVTPLQKALQRLLSKPEWLGGDAKSLISAVVNNALSAEAVKTKIRAFGSLTGDRVVTVHPPGEPGTRVDVDMKLRFHGLRIERRMSDDGGHGAIERKQTMVSHTSGRSRSWPFEFGKSLATVVRWTGSPVPVPTGGFGFGYGQAGKTSSGIRFEHAGKEAAPTVLVRVRYIASFDLSKRRAWYVPGAKTHSVQSVHGAPGEATLQIYEHDLPLLLRQLSTSQGPGLDETRHDWWLSPDGGPLGGDPDLAGAMPATGVGDLDAVPVQPGGPEHIAQLVSEWDAIPADIPVWLRSDPAAALATELTSLADQVTAAVQPPHLPTEVLEAVWRVANDDVRGAAAQLRDARAAGDPAAAAAAQHDLRKHAASMVKQANAALRQAGQPERFGQDWRHEQRNPVAEARRIAVELGRPVRLAATLPDGTVEMMQVNPDRTLVRSHPELITAEVRAEAGRRGLDLVEMRHRAMATGRTVAEVVRDGWDGVVGVAARWGIDIDQVAADVDVNWAEALQDTQQRWATGQRLAEAFDGPVEVDQPAPDSAQQVLQERLQQVIAAKDAGWLVLREAMAAAGVTEADLVNVLQREAEGHSGFAAAVAAAQRDGTDPVAKVRALVQRAAADAQPAPSSLPELAGIFGYRVDEQADFAAMLLEADLLNVTPAQPDYTRLLGIAGHLAVRYGLNPAQRRRLLEVDPRWFTGQNTTRLPAAGGLPPTATQNADGQPAEFRRHLRWIVDHFYHGMPPGRAYRGDTRVPPAELDRVAHALLTGGVPNAAREAAQLPGSHYQGSLTDAAFSTVIGDPNTPSPTQLRTLGQYGSETRWIPPGDGSVFDAIGRATGRADLRGDLAAALRAELDQDGPRPLWDQVPELRTDDARRAALASLDDAIDRRLAPRLPALLATTADLGVTTVGHNGEVTGHGRAGAPQVTLLRTGEDNHPHHMPVLGPPTSPVELPPDGPPPGVGPEQNGRLAPVDPVADRIEQHRGVPVRPAEGVPGVWVDENGRTHRPVDVDDETQFEQAWTSSRAQIEANLGTSLFVPVDVSRLNDTQLGTVRDFVQQVAGGDRVLLLGDPSGSPPGSPGADGVTEAVALSGGAPHSEIAYLPQLHAWLVEHGVDPATLDVGELSERMHAMWQQITSPDGATIPLGNDGKLFRIKMTLSEPTPVTTGRKPTQIGHFTIARGPGMSVLAERHGGWRYFARLPFGLTFGFKRLRGEFGSVQARALAEAGAKLDSGGRSVSVDYRGPASVVEVLASLTVTAEPDTDGAASRTFDENSAPGREQ